MRKITAAYNTIAKGGGGGKRPAKGKGPKGGRYDNILDYIYDVLGPSAEVSGTTDYEKLMANGITLKYYPDDNEVEVTGKDKKLVSKVKDLLGDISDLSSIMGPDSQTADEIAELLGESKVVYDEGWYKITGRAKARSTYAVVYVDSQGSCIAYAGEKISTRWGDISALAKTLGGAITKIKTSEDALEELRDIAYTKTDYNSF